MRLRGDGVDLASFAKVVGGGGANSGIFQLLVPKLLENGDYTGLQFSLANAAKDLRYYNRMVADVPLTAPMGPAVLNSLVSALNGGFAEGIVGHMVAAHCKLNGVELERDSRMKLCAGPLLAPARCSVGLQQEERRRGAARLCLGQAGRQEPLLHRHHGRRQRPVRQQRRLGQARRADGHRGV